MSTNRKEFYNRFPELDPDVFCKRGHNNWGTNDKGVRRCLTCSHLRAKARWAKKKALNKSKKSTEQEQELIRQLKDSGFVARRKYKPRRKNG